MALKNTAYGISVFALICISVYIYIDINSTKADVNAYSQLETGKTFRNLQLIDIDGKTFDPLLELKKPLLTIFVFSQKCPACDPNLFFWTKLNNSFNSKMDFLGIIFGTPENLKRFKEIKKTNFEVYRTDFSSQLKEMFKVRFRLSQTIILKHGKVVFHEAGELTVKEFFEIKNKIIGGTP